MKGESMSMKRTMVGALAIALLATGGGLATGTAAAETDTDEGGKHLVVQGKSAAITITQEQARELKTAWDANRNLSAEQALAIVGKKETDLAATEVQDVLPDEGEGTVTGDCSEMTFWANSDGHWSWRNDFFPRSAGPAVAGSGRVRVDGYGNIPDYFSFEGLKPRENGQVPLVGIDPWGADVTVWSFNQPLDGDIKLCYGDLYVLWKED